MLAIVAAIYDMMGRCAEPNIERHTVNDHVDRVFQVHLESYYLFLLAVHLC